ncbi:MAG: hypothetical protein ACRDGD_09885 [Candidatus Limnocylindria bacterium]
MRAVPPYLDRPTAQPSDADSAVALPYGLSAAAVVAAVNDIHAYLYAMNSASVEHGYQRLEELMQPAAFSGMLSGLAVESMARETEREGAHPGLRPNRYHNGRPDLVPRGTYPSDAVQHGDEGIEVKASRAVRGWQGHNIEVGWLMVVQFSTDTTTQPIYGRAPTTIERVMVASLDEADWSFSGRSATSRRTPTASVGPTGYAKLIVGAVYERGRSAGQHPPDVT